MSGPDVLANHSLRQWIKRTCEKAAVKKLHTIIAMVSGSGSLLICRKQKIQNENEKKEMLIL